MALSVSPTGDVVYEDYKGYEDPLRKHHTSAVTRDIWLYRPATGAGEGLTISGDGAFHRLSGFSGEDRNPVFGADGRTYYYLSEKDGTFNVYRSSVATPGEDTQLTSFRGYPVRHLSAARNGTLCFSWNGDLYTLKAGGQPEKLAVTVHKDETENPVEFLTFSSAATAMKGYSHSGALPVSRRS
jgi:tricorn protease-like protein